MATETICTGTIVTVFCADKTKDIKSDLLILNIGTEYVWSLDAVTSEQISSAFFVCACPHHDLQYP